MGEQLGQTLREVLSKVSVESVFSHAKFFICESKAFHNLEQGEWCLRRCAELCDERAIRILDEYKLTGDLIAAFNEVVKEK